MLMVNEVEEFEIQIMGAVFGFRFLLPNQMFHHLIVDLYCLSTIFRSEIDNSFLSIFRFLFASSLFFDTTIVF